MTIDDVGVRRERVSRQPGRDVFGDDLGGVGKSLAVRELLAIVDDVDAEADFVRELARDESRRAPRR